MGKIDLSVFQKIPQIFPHIFFNLKLPNLVGLVNPWHHIGKLKGFAFVLFDAFM